MIKSLSKVLLKPIIHKYDVLTLSLFPPVTCCGICGTDQHLAEVSVHIIRFIFFKFKKFRGNSSANFL